MVSSLLDIQPNKEYKKKFLNLSTSKVKIFDACKAQYKFNYIEKLPKKDWEFLLVGKFLHCVLEYFHKKIASHSNETPWNELMSLAFQRGLAEYSEKLTTEQLNECKEICIKYLKYTDNLRKEKKLPQLIDTEKDFFINIDDTVLLTGSVDKLQIDPDGIVHVIDYKTSKKEKYLKEDNLQLLTYAFVVYLINPSIEKVRASFMLLYNDFKHITWEFNVEEILSMEKKYLEYAALIKNEEAYQAEPSILCKYCSYLDNCIDGAKFLASIPEKKKNRVYTTPTSYGSDW